MAAPPAVAQSAIDQARRQAERHPGDAHAWHALGSLLYRAGRLDEAAEAFEHALALAPAAAPSRFALGLVELNRGRIGPARELLTRSADELPSSAAPLVALARLHEAAGQLDDAVRAYAEASRREPAHLFATLGRGIVLHRMRRLDDARAAFAAAVTMQPDSPEAWTNLAAALADLGRLDEAVSAAQRAVALRPGLAAANANLGDLLCRQGRYQGAAEAYGQALAARPNSAEVLNKLGVLRRIMGDLGEAGRLLEQALAFSPRYPTALVNLGSVRIEQRRTDEGQALLSRALALPGIDADARADAEGTLAALGEHRRLAPAIARAITERGFAALRAAVAATPVPLLSVDKACVESLVALTANRDGSDRLAPGFAPARAADPAWPAIEAHFAFHGGDAIAAIAASRERLERMAPESGSAALSAHDADLVHYARAVRLSRTVPLPGQDGVDGETWVRFWHAQLCGHRPQLFPGQFKPVANLVRANPGEPRTPPLAVAGTFRAFFAEAYARATPGPVRAALVYHAVTKIHGFMDGNGRLARFLLNRELEATGLAPLIVRDAVTPALIGALRASRAGRTLDGTLAALAEASRDTTAVLGELEAHWRRDANPAGPALPAKS